MIKPKWALTVQHIMLEKNMTKRQLAHELGVGYSHLCNVMNGYTTDTCTPLKSRILAFFEIAESEA